MKVGGSSIEVALIPFCGERDLITGTGYAEEASSLEYDYLSRNSQEKISLFGNEATEYLLHCKEIGVLTHPPITEEVLRTTKSVECFKEIFHAHATPRLFAERESDFLECNDYYKFTVARNPWDMMVSYYWWCYSDYEPAISVEGVEIVSSRAENTKWMRPNKDDSQRTLMIKFSAFLKIVSVMDGPYGRQEDVNVLDWMSRFTSEFYEDDYMNLVLRFESLQSDFNSVCDELSIQRTKLPHLKSSIRKKKLHYSRYYTERSRDKVAAAFLPVIQKFNYSFKDPA
jgi:hypothetical protein